MRVVRQCLCHGFALQLGPTHWCHVTSRGLDDSHLSNGGYKLQTLDSIRLSLILDATSSKQAAGTISPMDSATRKVRLRCYTK